ncbi:alpha/beta fold hydrolase [Oleiagrimonas sp.]|jgi:pimeloyl-ACP methyl ester carboxylesterase|uniref:alpha/beta fold hydrolase n=1 Tax=Oleiagrimonas sp. TaxID=2010330 RepID=UPI002624F031|nr:alpha/beta fold hydrolase [Oleiagrimonas sp.]MDA3913951.1 alpha/beta fold hydrolase [Oleiagrimonas sp.]
MTETDIPVAIPGLPLAARVHGPRDAPPLLALHGWLDNAASFDRLASLLALHHRVIALDLPGHGRSAHLPPGAFVHYHIADYVAAVLAAADVLGLEQFDLLGHSLGAGVASLVAAAAPERVRRLALIEGLGPLADDPGNTLERFRHAADRRLARSEPRLRTFADIDAAVQVRSRASRMDASLARPIVERGLVEVDGGYRWSSDPRLTQPTPVRLAESQVRTLLAGISAPTWLLLAHPQTPYLPEDMLRARAAVIPAIRIDHMDGSHHLHLEHPEAVARLLLDHFSLM